MAKTALALSRKAQLLRGALRVYIAPKLAQDAKLDLTPIVLGVTAKNFGTSKLTIADRLKKATVNKLAKDANLEDVHGLLDRLDGEGADERDDTPADLRQSETDPQERTDNPAVDGLCEAICKLLEGKVPPEVLEEVRTMCESGDDEMPDAMSYMPADAEMDGKSPEERAKMMRAGMDKYAKDKAAYDKRAMDKAARDKARDAETEEEKKDKEADMEKKREAEARDKAARDKKAMDAALRETEERTITRLRSIADAEKFVRPWVGELDILAQDSASAVYKLALDSLGVNTSGMHPDAYRAVLEAQPKPGDRQAQPRQAFDKAGSADFATRYPETKRLRAV